MYAKGMYTVLVLVTTVAVFLLCSFQTLITDNLNFYIKDPSVYKPNHYYFSHQTQSPQVSDINTNPGIKGRKIKFTSSTSSPLVEHSNYSSPFKKLLIWNEYWGSTALWQKIFFEIIHQQCPQSNCILTMNRSEIQSADAILFHLPDFNRKNDPAYLPQFRKESQIWIAMTYEPPYVLKRVINMTLLNHIFNRTMSLRADSDITTQHGTFSEIGKDHKFPNFILPQWFDSHISPQRKNYAQGKKKLAAWFASSRNCHSESQRELYVKELQKYISVDVYGACGTFSCGTRKTMSNPYSVEHDDCYRKVSNDYKFVLAFENSICQDYVTEKLYNNLKLNVVPVVLGGANYSQATPPHSVIDALKYTPQELANYLTLLHKNDTLYNEYFEWKEKYYVISHDGVPLACDLCQQLHSPRWGNERKVIERMDEWLLQACRPGWHP